MHVVRIEVGLKPGLPDPRGAALCARLQAAGLTGLTGVEGRDLYLLGGPALADADVARLVERLLVDPVEQQVVQGGGDHRVEIAPLPGVTDSAGEHLLDAAHALGVSALAYAGAGRAWVLRGAVDVEHLTRIAAELLGNPVVEAIRVDAPVPVPFALGQPVDATVEVEAIRALDADGLLALGARRRLALNGAELSAIQAHYRRLDRDPTDAELEMLAQTWSEHCVHKTFKARIHLTEAGRPPEIVDGLFNQYIKAATVKADSPWLRSVFVDNAGVVAFDDQLDVAFKVETHNHPSAIDPFGGANTGVGGVIRDVMGVSARPIACTDVLCFGPADTDAAHLPAGVLHPARVAEGVIAGVGDYGNKMGIPTVNGAILYDPDYRANPLVFCGCLGVAPRGSHPRAPQVGDRVIVIGGHTGRDGLRGATFSSMEMGADTAAVAGSSVQIGHPIHQKQVLEVVVEARDLGLYTAITDCGAGGLSSAVGEMAAELGAAVELRHVPLKYAGLRPWEIWLSEAQERMVLAVPPAHVDALRRLCRRHGVSIADLGHFTGDGRLDLRYDGAPVVDLSMAFLHDGIPRREMTATWTPPAWPTSPPESADLAADLLALLASPDIASKEAVVRTYDHEVQGGTVVRPFVGVDHHGPSDAAVLRPFGADDAHHRAVALSNGINPHYGRLDPYAMAWAAVDEAFRNAVAVGADPRQVALLDNFCWGNPQRPETLGALTLAARGCHDAAVALQAAYISGKDSLNNEFLGEDGERHAIPGTLLISALGLVPDLRRAVTMDAKAAGDVVYVVGETRAETGGSAWARLRGGGGPVPAPNPGALALFSALHAAIAAGLVRACHDCSEGGLAVALAEVALAGGLGLDVDVRRAPGAATLPPGVALFAESSSRFVVAVAPADAAAFEAALADHPCAALGAVTAASTVRMAVDGGTLAWDLGDLARAFGGGG
ncbi:MAG: phosphoribosylformylglycinamidine synthase subunit PurL [Myxococcales bacterium]|nr:phosphoribosylformylglycinamidine synthase subunit PurL [Myxococcales bacterium]